MTAFDDLAKERRWVLWSWKERPQGPTKVPMQRSGAPASSTDPSTWATLHELEGAKGFSGVGIMLTGDGLGGIDLDHCRDPVTGAVDPWAAEIIADFGSYAEVSPSGTGVKILALGAPEKLPGSKWTPEGVAPKETGMPHADIFTDKRFFTVTRKVLDSVPDEIVDAGDVDGAWNRLCYRIGKYRSQTERVQVSLPDRVELDDALLSRMREIPVVWARWINGTEGGADRSSNDAALASAMAGAEFTHREIRAALEGYKLGQIGSGKLTGGDAERQVLRLLELSEGHRPRASYQHPDEIETLAQVVGEGFARAQEQVRKEAERRAQEERESVLFTPEQASVAYFLENHPPERQWILPGVLPLGVGAMFGGAGGVGKSYSTLLLAVSICLGIDFWGLGQCNPGKVMIFSAEDDRDEMHRRLHKVLDWMIAAGVPFEPYHLEGRLFISDRVGKDNLMTVVRDREVQRTAMAERIARTVAQVPGVSLVILDPLSRFRGGSGNAEEEATRFVEAVESVRTYTGATVLLPVHLNKAASRSGDSSQDAIRGSSALVDGMRWVGTLLGMSEQVGEERGMKPGDHKQWARFEVAKGNYSAPFPGIWLKRQQGGILAPEELPDARAATGPNESEGTYVLVLGKLRKILQAGPVSMKTLKNMSGKSGLIPVGINRLSSIVYRAAEEGYLVVADEPGTPNGKIVSLANN
jgi:hypothetical protein